MSGSLLPPIKFPPGIVDPVAYFHQRAEEILKDPPLLSASALRASLGEGATGVHEAAILAQKAILEGRLSDSLGLLELCAANHPHAAALAGLVSYALGLVEKAVFFWESISHMIPEDSKPSLYSSLVNLGDWMRRADPSLDPETDALAILCSGKGLDVGYGGAKTCPSAISVGGGAGQAKADTAASGDYLPMFADGQMDYVIARHSLGRCKDHVKALLEWMRVLKAGGLLAVATPDHDWVDTIKMDATHTHAFTAESLERLFSLLPGMNTLFAGGLVPRWSIMAVAQKAPASRPYDYFAAVRSRDMARIRRRMAIHRQNGREWLAGECQRELSRLGGKDQA